jgi:hypothetical protein
VEVIICKEVKTQHTLHGIKRMERLKETEEQNKNWLMQKTGIMAKRRLEGSEEQRQIRLEQNTERIKKEKKRGKRKSRDKLQ